MFDEQGLFNCHHEIIDTVLRVLGKPDHFIKGADRNRYVWGFIGFRTNERAELSRFGEAWIGGSQIGVVRGIPKTQAAAMIFFEFFGSPPKP